MSAPKVRKGIAILSPFGALARDIRDLLARPLPLLGGVLGTGLLTGALGVFFLVSSTANAEDEDLLDIEFMPGEIARLGEERDPEDIPDKVVVDDQRAAEAEPEKEVTKEDKAPEKPKPEPKKNPRAKTKKRRSPPSPPKRRANSPTKTSRATTSSTIWPRWIASPATPLAAPTVGASSIAPVIRGRRGS